tara:strand:+ start:2569 stop:2718 length:150 start_codon:yes stop_codon:yes gene_type:complete
MPTIIIGALKKDKLGLEGNTVADAACFSQPNTPLFENMHVYYLVRKSDV